MKHRTPWVESEDVDRPAPGDDTPRWPTAPEPRVENGEVVNAKTECDYCGEPSTLGYRCSECGADLVEGS